MGGALALGLILTASLDIFCCIILVWLVWSGLYSGLLSTLDARRPGWAPATRTPVAGVGGRTVQKSTRSYLLGSLWAELEVLGGARDGASSLFLSLS